MKKYCWVLKVVSLLMCNFGGAILGTCNIEPLKAFFILVLLCVGSGTYCFLSDEK